MRTTARRRTSVLAGTALLGIVAVAGCSSDEPDDVTTPSPSAAATSSEAEPTRQEAQERESEAAAEQSERESEAAAALDAQCLIGTWVSDADSLRAELVASLGEEFAEVAQNAVIEGSTTITYDGSEAHSVLDQRVTFALSLGEGLPDLETTSQTVGEIRAPYTVTGNEITVGDPTLLDGIITTRVAQDGVELSLEEQPLDAEAAGTPANTAQTYQCRDDTLTMTIVEPTTGSELTQTLARR